VISSKAAIAHAKIDPEYIDETFFGNVIQSSLDASYLSRHVALKSGLPVKSAALTVNRLCGSGFESACLAAESIQGGRANVVLSGGTENMSAAPMVIDGVSARFGVALGKGLQANDILWSGLTDSYAGLPMGMTAENLGQKYGITRAECNAYALRSQSLWKKAYDAGVFNGEIESIEVKGRKGKESMSSDEHPRPETTLEGLTKLKPVFKEGGLVTAGTASGISDGSVQQPFI
jgi:acetyl-CoA acyltransferase 2